MVGGQVPGIACWRPRPFRRVDAEATGRTTCRVMESPCHAASPAGQHTRQLTLCRSATNLSLAPSPSCRHHFVQRDFEGALRSGIASLRRNTRKDKESSAAGGRHRPTLGRRVVVRPSQDPRSRGNHSNTCHQSLRVRVRDRCCVLPFPRIVASLAGAA